MKTIVLEKLIYAWETHSFNTEPHTLSVDVEKTQLNYAARPLCPYLAYQNYAQLIQGRYPKLEDFLSQFGIDITKPDKAPCRGEGGLITYDPIYTAIGSWDNPQEIALTLHFGPLPATVEEAKPSSDSACSHLQISVAGITLPWELQEPCPQELQKVYSPNLFDLRQWCLEHNVLTRTESVFWIYFDAYKKDEPEEFETVFPHGRYDVTLEYERVQHELSLPDFDRDTEVVSVYLRIFSDHSEVGYFKMQFCLDGTEFDEFFVIE